MTREKNKFIIAGAGGIGKAVGLILADKPGLDSEIYIGDVDKNQAANVAQWIIDGCSTVCHVESFEIHPSLLTDEMDYIFQTGDIILDCLPGTEAPRMAAFALKFGMHYVNLTEYVQETEEIIQMVSNSDKGFVLQSGLAPGYVNILAHKLYLDFCERYKVNVVDHIKMRVGALTKNVESPHYYAFTWSPIGVATEYIKEAKVIQDGHLMKQPALSETSQRIINGILYEEDFTSGGAADLPEYFQGKARNLDYKTLRYPGHYNWVREQSQSNSAQTDSIQALLKTMQEQVPHIEDDQIVIYASVSSKDKNGNIHTLEHSQTIESMTIGSHKLKAIQITTAVPMLEAARMLLKSSFKGAVLQSQIDPYQFLSGPFVQMVYNNEHREHKVNLEH